MNKIVSYLASYFGNHETSVYPRVRGGKDMQTLHYTIVRANFAALHDTACEPTSSDWKNL
jgi:hypothetical protein